MQEQEKSNLSEQDAKFREEMKLKAETDPEAARWTRLDEKAQKLEGRVEHYQEKIEQRQGLGLQISELEQSITDQQSERGALLSRGKPPIWNLSERSAYNESLKGYDESIEAQQKQLQEAARKSSPEEIEALQNKLSEKTQALEKTTQERQGIAKLPSEEQAQRREQMNQASDQAAQSSGLAEKIYAIREDASQNDSQGGQQSSRTDWSKAANTLADADGSAARLKGVQDDLQRDLGRRATHDEVVAEEKKREQAQQRSIPSQEGDGPTMAQRIEQRRQGREQ